MAQFVILVKQIVLQHPGLLMKCPVYNVNKIQIIYLSHFNVSLHYLIIEHILNFESMYSISLLLKKNIYILKSYNITFLSQPSHF